MRKSVVVLFFAVVFFAIIISNNNKQDTCYNCNVVLISIDSLRTDHLGTYGYSRDITPNIDEFANSGIKFTNYISQSYLTPISEMSVHTSLYPHVHGLLGFANEALPDNETGGNYTVSTPTTIASVLKIYGYDTAIISSSIEISRLQLVAADPFNMKAFNTFEYTNGRNLPDFNNVTNWLDSNKNKKFFLYLPIGTIHQPFAGIVPSPLKSKFDPENYSGNLKDVSLDYPLFERIYNGTYHNLTADNMIKYTGTAMPDIEQYDRPVDFSFNLTSVDKSYIAGRYDAGINYVDSYIGAVIRQIHNLGLDKNTIVIIQSEHGEDLGEHGYYWHYDTYDTQIHTPLLIRNPALNKVGVIENQVQSIDIMPTVLDFLGIPAPSEAQGNSIKPLLEGKTNESFNKYVFVERPLWEERDSIQPAEDLAVRTTEWKLIYRDNSEGSKRPSLWGYVSGKNITIPDFELYNLRQDPYEQDNVVNQYPQIVEQLKQPLFSWWENISKIRVEKQFKFNATQIFPYP